MPGVGRERRDLDVGLADQRVIRVIGAHDIMAEALGPRGVLTRTQPDAQAMADIERGIAVVRALSTITSISSLQVSARRASANRNAPPAPMPAPSVAVNHPR